MPEDDDVSPEIHNITVEISGDNKFCILFGIETGIPDLYSASTRIEVDRALLEQFVENARKALNNNPDNDQENSEE